jgi:hypothetical protein
VPNGEQVGFQSQNGRDFMGFHNGCIEIGKIPPNGLIEEKQSK